MTQKGDTMTKHLLAVAHGVALAACLFVSAAPAAPVTLSFTGIIQPGSFTYDGQTDIEGDWDGEPFSGQITFDPLTTVVSTDNSTYQLNASYSAPALMSISLNLPDGVVVSGDNMSAPAYLMEIYRNYVNPPNTNALL
jgi:hypothetical protein